MQCQCSCFLQQVALHEGLMVSVSRAGSLELQTQLLEVRAEHFSMVVVRHAVPSCAVNVCMCPRICACCTHDPLGSMPLAPFTRKERYQMCVLFCCAMQWLLRPVHAKWTEARWLAHLDSPAAFAAEYMQYEVQADGTVVVGSR